MSFDHQSHFRMESWADAVSEASDIAARNFDEDLTTDDSFFLQPVQKFMEKLEEQPQPVRDAFVPPPAARLAGQRTFSSGRDWDFGVAPSPMNAHLPVWVSRAHYPVTPSSTTSPSMGPSITPPISPLMLTPPLTPRMLTPPQTPPMIAAPAPVSNAPIPMMVEAALKGRRATPPPPPLAACHFNNFEAAPRTPSPQGSTSSNGSPAGHCLFVYGVLGMNQALLWKVFGKFGTVTSVQAPPGKNFGFVHMSQFHEALTAVKVLDGSMMFGNTVPLQVSFKNK